MANTTRTMILANLRDKVELLGSANNMGFRLVKRGPWNPLNSVRPAAFICGFGQKRGDRINSDVTKCRVLSIRLWLDLDANWDRDSESEKWEENVQLLADGVQNFKAAGGMKRLDYMNDEQLEVVLMDGATRALWSLDFEAEYWVDVAAFG